MIETRPGAASPGHFTCVVCLASAPGGARRRYCSPGCRRKARSRRHRRARGLLALAERLEAAFGGRGEVDRT